MHQHHQKPLSQLHTRDPDDEILSLVFPSTTRITLAMENTSVSPHHTLALALLKLSVLKKLSSWKKTGVFGARGSGVENR